MYKYTTTTTTTNNNDNNDESNNSNDNNNSNDHIGVEADGAARGRPPATVWPRTGGRGARSCSERETHGVSTNGVTANRMFLTDKLFG